MPTPLAVAARGHWIEYSWNLSEPCEMQAYCRRCQTWFGAHCADSTEYATIRQSQQRAAAPFGDYDCFDVVTR